MHGLFPPMAATKWPKPTDFRRILVVFVPIGRRQVGTCRGPKFSMAPVSNTIPLRLRNSPSCSALSTGFGLRDTKRLVRGFFERHSGGLTVAVAF